MFKSKDINGSNNFQEKVKNPNEREIPSKSIPEKTGIDKDPISTGHEVVQKPIVTGEDGTNQVYPSRTDSTANPQR